MGASLRSRALVQHPRRPARTWLPSYYHRADKQGIGFDRSSKGSNAVAQYPENLSKQYDNISTCPEEYLLWFHHVPWNYRMKSGRTLWDEFCYHYDNGVRQVRDFQKIWDAAENTLTQNVP